MSDHTAGTFTGAVVAIAFKMIGLALASGLLGSFVHGVVGAAGGYFITSLLKYAVKKYKTKKENKTKNP